MAFYPLAKLVDLVDGYKKPFTVSGKNLLLVQEAGVTYLIEDRCPHMDVPLQTGSLENGSIRCRAHGIQFDLQSGAAFGPLASTLDCLVRYELVYDGGTIGVEL